MNALEPILLGEVELSSWIGPVSGCVPGRAERYRQARVLVRLHGYPLRLLDLDLRAGDLSAEALCALIWSSASAQIREHLHEDGLPCPQDLTPGGLAVSTMPRCRLSPAGAQAEHLAITAVVCTRDRPEHLAACLQHLLRLPSAEDQVLVVDNAPQTSATHDLVSALRRTHPRLSYVREDRPGLSWARNRALREVKTPIIAYTDDDVRVDTQWLLGLRRGFAAAASVAAVSGLTLPARLETPAELQFESLSSFTSGLEHRIHNVITRPLPETYYPYSAIRYGTGNNIAYRVSILRAIGGFDESICNGEDIECYFRVMSKGYTLVYEPSAIVRHFHRPDEAGLRRQIFEYGAAFTTFLAKSLIARPAMVPWLLRRSTAVVRRLLAHRPTPGPTGSAQEYARLRWQGMLYGPIWYAQQHVRYARTVARFGRLPSLTPGAVQPETPAS